MMIFFLLFFLFSTITPTSPWKLVEKSTQIDPDNVCSASLLRPSLLLDETATIKHIKSNLWEMILKVHSIRQFIRCM